MLLCFYILMAALLLMSCARQSRFLTYALFGSALAFNCLAVFNLARGTAIQTVWPHILGVNGAAAAAWVFTRKIACAEATAAEARLDIERELSDANQQYESVQARGKNIADELADRKRLYEVARNMAAVIEFDSLIVEMQSALSAFFEYEAAWVLVLTGEDADVAYDLRHPECFSTGEEVISPVLQEKLTSVGQTVYMPAETFSNEEGYLPEEVESFIAFPLDCAGKPGALVLVFNFTTPPTQQRLHEDNFDIIAALKNQFTIALNKCWLYREIEAASRVDALTQLSKRWYFMQRLHEEVERSDRRGLPLSIIMADIDRFKVFNDSYGHLAGDAVLKRTANLVRLNLRSIDLACRYGGEEFLLALPDTPKDAAVQVAERIREEVGNAEVTVRDVRAALTISLGVAAYPDDGSPAEAVITKADQMLYEAKRGGRNQTRATPSEAGRPDESDDSHEAL